MELKFNFASDTAIVLTSTEHSICIDDPTNVLVAHWVITEDDFGANADTLVMDGDAGAFNDAYVIDPGVDWELTCVATMLAASGSQDFEIGVAHWTGIAFDSKYAVNPLNSGATVCYLYGPGDSTDISGTAYNDGDELTIVLSWDASTTTLSVAITDGLTPHSTNLFDDFPPDSPLRLYVKTNGPEDGGLEVTELTLVIG